MHTIQKSGKDEETIWTVGFEQPAEKGLRNFRPIIDFTSMSVASQWCSWLNGGASPTMARMMEKGI